jgi:5,5'-dehydrodivanillate O-demethylase
MLSVEENQRLTQTGKGTPMGDLLRRYWHPIAAATEFEDRSTKPVRLLGEDLVLYRDLSGTYGLVELHCAHRRADLSYGYVEDKGLRCSYHGWCYDERGHCIAQPYEDMVSENTRVRDSIRLTAYPVCEKAGLLFAYLGPEPVPYCPTWEPFTWENCFCQIVFSDVPCNWLQATENNIDPVHFEWLHSNWSVRLAGREGPYSARHLRIGVDEWDFGFRYKRILENTDEDHENWVSGRLSILPNIFVPGHFEYRVPVDDTSTLSVVWHYTRVPVESEPYVQERIPHWFAPITDPVTGRWITSHVINQDTVAWTGQGRIADRENEHLARSDLGVIKLRNQLRADLEAVERGEDPKGVIRDPALAERVPWPFGKTAPKGSPRETFLAQQARRRGLPSFAPEGRRPTIERDYFPFLAGQPEDVRKAYEEAMGI